MTKPDNQQPAQKRVRKAPDPGATAGAARKRRARPLSARTLQIRDKQAQAVELRAAGHTFLDIANRLGYRDASAASKAVRAVVSRHENTALDELRYMHDLKFEAAYRVIYAIMVGTSTAPAMPSTLNDVERRKFLEYWAEVVHGNQELKLKAIDRLVRVMERQAKLYGMDAPAQTELTLEGGPMTVVFSEAMAYANGSQ